MNKMLFAVIMLIVAGASFAIGSQWSGWFAPTRSAVVAPGKQDVVPFDYQSPAPKISSSVAKGHRESHYQDMQNVDDVLELPTDFAQTEALFTVAGRANAEELEQLIYQSMRIADRYDRVAGLEILFSRYVELDPNAAVDFLLMIDLDLDSRLITSVFQSWAKFDTNSAIAKANSIVNVRQRKTAGNAVLSAMARNDPGMLEAVEAQLADRHRLDYFQSEAIGLRANYDPETALTDALQMKSRRGRRDAIRRVGAVWARNDPAAAISFAQGIDDLSARQQFVASVFERWIGDDPEGAMQSMLATPNPRERNQYLQNGLVSYAQTDPKQALSLVSQLNGQARVMAYQSIFSIWVSQDPDAAMQEFAIMEDSPTKQNLLGQIGQSLANTDPDAALLWANSLNASQRAANLPNILGQLARSDPQRALEAAIAESPENRSQVLSLVLRSVVHSYPQLAMQYIAELPAGHERDNLYTEIAGNLAAYDPQAAMAWASTITGQAHINAVSGIAGVVARTDPDLAASMIGQVPAEQRGELLRSISSVMARQDPTSALTWLSRFRDSPEYDSAAATIAMNLAYRDPRYALRIANGLGTEHREQAIQGVLSAWSMNDPVAASRWAAGSDADQRARAVSTVAMAWARRDPLQASRWVRSLRSGEVKDHALISLVSSARLDTREISKLIQTIGSDEQRDQAIFGAYMRLRHENKDIDAANELLDQVDASDSVRQQLLQSGG